MAQRLSQDERARIAEKIMEVGNLTFAALILGQVLSDKVDVIVAIGGALVFSITYYVAYLIMSRR